MDEAHINRVKKPSLQTQHQLTVSTANGLETGEKLRRSSVGVYNSSDANPNTSGMDETPVGKFVDQRSSRQAHKGREDSKRGYSLPRFDYDLVDQPMHKESTNTAFAKIGKVIWNFGGEVITLRKTPPRKSNSQPSTPRKGSLQPEAAVNKEIRRKSMPGNFHSKIAVKKKKEKKLIYSTHEEETVNVTLSLKINNGQEQQMNGQNVPLSESVEVENDMKLKSPNETVDVAYTLTIENPYSVR